MQVAYNKNNIDLNYLNCYVKFYLDNDTLYLHNTIYDKKIVLKADSNYLKEFIISLHQGIKTKDLIKVLIKISNEPEKTYEYLLQNFIIE